MWQDILIEACSEFEHKFPGALEQLQSITPQNAWDHEHFSNAAMVIIEPNVFLKREDCDDLMQSYYERSEKDLGFIKHAIHNPLWFHVIDTVQETGY